MVSTAEELKAEDELLNEAPVETTAAGDAPKAEENAITTPPIATETTTETEATPVATATTAPPVATTNGKANGKNKKGKRDEPDPMEETHVTEFDVEEHSKTLLDQMQIFREEKTLNDGHLVFASEGERKRISLLMSSISAGSVKLMNSFFKAKKIMMEHGFFHTSIDLKLPQFAQPGQSSPETAVRSLVNYIYNGTLDVSPTSIKNITVLASYLEVTPILEKIPSLAEQMGVSDFDFEDLKKKASDLPEMTVDGLKKFVDAGFGTVTKMKTPSKTGDKRKPNQANKKKEPAVKKPKVEGEQPQAEAPAATTDAVKDETPAATDATATEPAVTTEPATTEPAPVDAGEAKPVETKPAEEPTTIVQAADDDVPETSFAEPASGDAAQEKPTTPAKSPGGGGRGRE